MKLFAKVVVLSLLAAFHDISAFVVVTVPSAQLSSTEILSTPSSSSLSMVMNRRGSIAKSFKSTPLTTMLTTTTTRQYASPKVNDVDDDKTSLSSSTTSEGYNDDAFGLVFLVSAFATQDQDFAALFLITSAIAATLTLQNIIKYDVRIPAVVAWIAILVTPLEMSLRFHTDLQPPSMTTVGLGVASVAFAFFNYWRRPQEY
mmetsp:Transcript_11734/g.15467  ORF Transcript_11734/g.15467 Transcript_11734/m.15467 type:complete len:202 (-) Transcript_11734:875-1480(-)|eukprot:CAMPEP_0195262630 /NCGR_PEP_ID=MMETSP0706-20130129/9859_1 /TAXON_ID=33640 /ORGANISM="Asterionellopsis glacialis, Strain CCMP134" /LENGTH=201 /DNA_ID=CAMNT_0040316727 /DNA_START=337 /DNA_END=942 /DNA_ORIENTATION=-